MAAPPPPVEKDSAKKEGQRNFWKAKITKLLIKHQDADPDAVSKDKEFRIREHDNLFWKMETHMIMHDLAFEYYWQRAFILNVTILVMGVTISIIGIMESSARVEIDIDANGTVEDFFEDGGGGGGNSTASEDTQFRFLQEVEESSRRGITNTQIIAILGILITFMKSFEKYFGYQSRADLHESAVGTLKDICDELFTTRLDVDLMCDECDPRFPTPDGHTKPTEKEFKEKREKVKLCKAKFDTMQKACTDPIPPPLVHQFVELREVLKLAPYDLKFFLYRRYYHKLAQRLRKSYMKFNPPFFLHCFSLDDIYEELYYDAYAFIGKWMVGDNARKATDFHPEKIRESTRNLTNGNDSITAINGLDKTVKEEEATVASSV